MKTRWSQARIEGADTIVWLAAYARQITGKFLRDRKEIPW
jgi:hypothetical protein